MCVQLPGRQKTCARFLEAPVTCTECTKDYIKMCNSVKLFFVCVIVYMIRENTETLIPNVNSTTYAI